MLPVQLKQINTSSTNVGQINFVFVLCVISDQIIGKPYKNKIFQLFIKFVFVFNNFCLLFSVDIKGLYFLIIIKFQNKLDILLNTF